MVEVSRSFASKILDNGDEMKTYKTVSMAFLIVLVILLSACQAAQPSDEVQVAVIVALTQTAAALENPAPPVQVVDTPRPSGDYQPLAADECTDLKDALSQTVGLPGEVVSSVPFDDYVNEKSGFGCQIAYSVSGENEPPDVRAVLPGLGWQENDAYAAAGIGGMTTAYQNGDALCLYLSEVKPADENACPLGDGYIQCAMDLPPEQLLRTVSLNCARPVP
jgi:hypothetical protein